jgi:hypothetical protein
LIGEGDDPLAEVLKPQAGADIGSGTVGGFVFPIRGAEKGQLAGLVEHAQAGRLVALARAGVEQLRSNDAECWEG